MITVNLKKGVFNTEFFENTVFELTPCRELLAFTVLSNLENGEPWEGARSENTVLECLWGMNEEGAQWLR